MILNDLARLFDILNEHNNNANFPPVLGRSPHKAIQDNRAEQPNYTLKLNVCRVFLFYGKINFIISKLLFTLAI